jgi:UDP-2,3-diacylglucosamine hydrolase
MIHVPLQAGQQAYFASDFHLGAPDKEASRLRERKIVRWLDQIAPNAAHIFLLGDVFDFWYEYAQVVPKGFIRFQGKLAELADAGIPISLFTGNHDLWIKGYFTEELGIPVYRSPQEAQVGGLRLQLGHGDGLGPGDYGYKRMKRFFVNPYLQWCFSRLHPDFAVWLGHTWSVGRKKRKGVVDQDYAGPQGEYLWHYCHEQEALQHRDAYIFGHRHLPLDMPIGASRYVNLGEWFRACTYAACDGQHLQLLAFEGTLPKL